MHRRTLLQSLLAVVAATPLGRLDVFAQSSALNDTEITTLHALAEVVLPASLSAADRDEAVATFVRWVRNYHEGADRGHGYGNSQVQRPTGPSPAARYPEQFAALDTAAAAQGAASFSALPPAARRTIVAAALNDPQPVTRLPGRPTGQNLVADFMGLYFNGADANDRCYQAAIQRDACRGLDGSDRPPTPLGGH
jgi:Gluconate 2-dehydrogenase subunit 3